ncbi:MAG TPA: hypothetical protein VJC16_04295 [Candidatus Nanoarchaeia archaeon]|nr:hypothetical protein [Candidatus Nanoarchaeia archaeon]
MSKKEQLENLAAFIGLRAAHEILIKMTNKQESVVHLGQEADTYSDLSFELSQGNWNDADIQRMKDLAKKRCKKKLGKYGDIGEEKYDGVERVIENIMHDLELG